jgi:hypothetical protein
MDRIDELDQAYGLLVALGQNRQEAPEPDLMDAFNLITAHHHPSTLVLPSDPSFDAQLVLAHDLLLHLAETANELGEALDMYDAATMVKSVIDGRSRP